MSVGPVALETDVALHQDPMPGVSNGKLAMWLFLVSDAMSFIGLLVAYVAVRWTFPDELVVPFKGKAWDPNEWFGFFGIQLTAFNTFVLICSSVTMVQGLAAFQEGNLRRGRAFLLATALGGSIFLGVQAYEWTHMIHEQRELVPHLDANGEVLLREDGSEDEEWVEVKHDASHEEGAEHGHGSAHGSAAAEEHGRVAHTKHISFNLQAATFYATTGFHGCHVFGGVVLLLLTYLLGKLGMKRWIEPNTIECVGLYWHFVDLVWILIFTFVYLI